MDNHQADTATQSTSWLDRFLSAEQPGLFIVGFGVVALAIALGMVDASEPGREALQVVGRTLVGSSIWSTATLLIALWLLSTVITHFLAKFMELRAPFPRALRITGRVWILHTMILIVVHVVLIALVSVGSIVLAEFWYIAVGGGVLWVFFYPAAIRVTYGSRARSCLMTFFTIAVALLTGIPAALLILRAFR